MKKNFIKMLAAIFFCGTMTTVFTACGDDDDDKNQPKTPEEQKEEQKATKGDVTLTFIAQPKSLQYFEYDFKYVDAKGNTKTIDIDQNTQSSGTLDEFEFSFIKASIAAVAAVPAYADLNDPFVYRVTLKDQPVGGTVTYTTTCHVKEGASITETLQYATPTVFRSLKLENGERVSLSGVVSFKTWKITPEKWDDYVSTVEGKVINEASGEVSVSK
jgi:hypothetical protein